MSTPTSIGTEYPVINSVASTFGGWVLKHRQNRQDRQDHRSLDKCGSHEATRILRDVGLSSHDLRQMMNFGPGALIDTPGQS